jgi:hypothetical protein
MKQMAKGAAIPRTYKSGSFRCVPSAESYQIGVPVDVNQ